MPVSLFDHGAGRLDEIVGPDMLCVFDFDGTLAPIARMPHQAQIPNDILRKLRQLGQLAKVAIITGRALADIRDRLDFEPDAVIGNHGIEGVPGLTFPAERYKQDCLEWARQIPCALKNHGLSAVGIWIENKTYSLSVHYRGVVGVPGIEEKVHQLLMTLTPRPRLLSGKCVVNVMPSDAPHKGEALDAICRSTDAKCVLYVGDDVTDEDVFAADRKDWLSIRIEDSAVSAAEFHLPHRLAMGRLLDEVINRLNSR